MVKDRLKAFQAAKSSREEPDGTNTSEDDPLITKEHWTNIESFLSRCTKVNSSLEDLESYVNSIRDIHGIILSNPDPNEDVRKKLADLVEKFTSLARDLRKDVDQLTKEANAHPLSAPASHAQSADNRIKKMQIMTIQRRLYQVVTRFNSEETDYKERHLAKIKHYLQLHDHVVEDDEIMKVLETGQIDQMTTGLMLATAEKKALYAEVRSRRDELLRLEASMRQLHELFHDLHLLVLSQGEMIDNIEMNIQSTVDYADKAKVQVQDARKLQKRARRMKIIICIGLIVLAIILFFIIQGLVCHFTVFC